MDTFNVINKLITLIPARRNREIYCEGFENSDSFILFDGIKQGRYTSDEEVLKDMFSDKKDPYGSYRVLSKRLISTLIGNIIIKPTELKEDYKSVFQDIRKKCLIVELLQSEGMQGLAMDISKKALKNAVKYQLTQSCIDLSKALLIISQSSGNRKETGKYKALYEHFKLIGDNELSSFLSINEVGLITANNKKPSDRKMTEILSLLDSVLKMEGDSYLIKLRKFRARILKANLISNHIEALIVYRDLIKYTKGLKFTPPQGHVLIILQQLNLGLIITQNFDVAKKNIEKCLSIRQKGEHNWQLVLQHKVILGFQSKKYVIAKNAITQSDQNLASGFMLEWWKITKMYLFFLSTIKKVRYNEKVKVSKIVNELPVYSADKQGANVSILIVAKYLIPLAEGKRDSLIDDTEALRKYSFRNLKEVKNKRARIFLWILRKISDCDFKAEKFKRTTLAKFNQLKATPMMVEDMYTEIIPFEHLYEMIIDILIKQEKPEVINKLR